MNTLLWICLTGLAPILWGSTYIVTSELLPEGAPFTAAVIRCLPVGFIMIAISRHMPARTQWKQLILLSFFNFTGLQGLLFVAAYRLPGGLAAVIGSIQPLIVIGLGWLVLSQKPAGLTVLACLTAIVGMALLIMAPMADGVHWDTVGMAAAFFGSASMAVGTFFSKHWQCSSNRSMPLMAFTGWQLTLGGIMLLPFSMLLEPELPTLSQANIVGFSYLAVCGSLFAYLVWFAGIRVLSSTAVSALGLLSPVSAIILGWTILGQAIEGWALIGLCIVVSSVLVVQYRQARPHENVSTQPVSIHVKEKIA